MPKVIAADVPQEILDEINTIDWSQLADKKVKELVNGLRSIITMKRLPKK